MALSCDLRLCGEDAVLGLQETGLAIIPGITSSNAGGTQRLPRLVGKSIAKELIFIGWKMGGRDALSKVCAFYKHATPKMIHLRMDFSAGLVNYFISSGEARTKALEIAWDIKQKVFYNTTQSYHAYYGHKTDTRAVLVCLLVVLSGFQFLNQWTRYKQFLVGRKVNIGYRKCLGRRILKHESEQIMKNQFVSLQNKFSLLK